MYLQINGDGVNDFVRIQKRWCQEEMLLIILLYSIEEVQKRANLWSPIVYAQVWVIKWLLTDSGMTNDA